MAAALPDFGPPRILCILSGPLTKSEHTEMTKEEMQARLNSAVAKMESHYEKLKADVHSAGDSASDEAREAVAKAETLLQKGKAKAYDLSKATHEEYEALKASAEDDWDAVASKLESSWDDFSAKVRHLFS